MRFIDFLLTLFRSFKIKPSISISIPLGSGYVKDKPMERKEDQKLSDHFSLFEMTVTANGLLQEQNRILSDEQMQKLEKLSRHAEVIRSLCKAPVHIHSGYRCGTLNGSTVGSSTTSQHPKCEAIDFDVAGQEVEDTFTTLLDAARKGELRFGQLILECAYRPYGVVKWIHCSVIGSLPAEKVGQVLKMNASADGKPVYTLIERIKQC